MDDSLDPERKPLLFTGRGLAETSVGKLCNTAPTRYDVRRICLMGKRGRCALAKGLLSFNSATIDGNQVKLRRDEADKNPLSMLPAEFRVLQRDGMVQVTNLTLAAYKSAMTGLPLQGLTTIRFADCKSEDSDVIGLIDANADTLKTLCCPPLGVLLKTKPLALDLLVMEQIHAPRKEVQRSALLRHHIKEFEYLNMDEDVTLTPGFIYWLPVEKLALEGVDNGREFTPGARNEDVKHVKITVPWLGGYREEGVARLLPHYAETFPHLEELIVSYSRRYTVPWHTYFDWLDFDVDVVFEALQRIEDALRSSPPTFKVTVQAKAEYVRFRKFADPELDLPESHVPESFDLMDSVDPEETGYGHWTYEHRPDLGPNVDFVAQMKFSFEEE